MFIRTKFDISSNRVEKLELENSCFLLLNNCFFELFRMQFTNFKSILPNEYTLRALAIAFVLIAAVAITPKAFAYKDGDFPGVGNYNDWVKANGYFNQANNSKGIAEKAVLYKKAISIYPYDAGYWINYASSAITDEQEKINCFLKAAQLNPDDPLGYQDAGVEYQKIGQYQKAIECYEKVLAINPSLPDFYVGILNCFLSLKKYNEAAMWSLKGYRLTKDPDLLYNAGYSYDKGKEYKLALKYYQEYLKLNPTDKDTIDLIKAIKSK